MPKTKKIPAAQIAKRIAKNSVKMRKFKISRDTFDQASLRLSDLGYSESQIEKIILKKSHRRSYNYLLNHHENLLRVNPDVMTHEKITRMVKHKGGGKNLEAFLTHHSLLTGHEFGFNLDDVIDMASHGGGSQNLEAVIKYSTDMINMGLSRRNITHIVNKDGGSLALIKASALCTALVELGFAVDDFSDLLINKKTLPTLISVRDKTPDLLKSGYSIADIKNEYFLGNVLVARPTSQNACRVVDEVQSKVLSDFDIPVSETEVVLEHEVNDGFETCVGHLVFDDYQVGSLANAAGQLFFPTIVVEPVDQFNPLDVYFRKVNR